MALSEFGILYAVHIITIQFGSVVSKVCECLLRKGPLSLRDIYRLAESENIDHHEVKDILYLLIQHNCVQAFSYGSESKAIVQYLVRFNNILHRVRYNKFSRVVKEELGTQCSIVLECLLNHGRLTLGQLIEIIRDLENKIGLEEIRESLRKLVVARFVERVPSPEPVLEKKEQGPAGPAPKKRGAKAAKIFKESESLEERVLEAATPVEALRLPLIFEQVSNSSLPENDNNISECKRKRDMDSSDPSNEIIWRPNFEEFIRRLRHKACVEIVKECMDEVCAVVLRAMLEKVGRSQEKKVTTDKSVPMSVGSIYEEVIKTEAGFTMLQEQVEASLDQLSSASLYLPAFVTKTDDSYTVDFKSILSVAQKDEMEALVMRRYGKEAFRIFRYLSQEGSFVETDKIADATLTEKNDAWKILLKMWKDGYLHIQKLVVVTRVYMPFLLWKVNKLIVSRQMLDEMYHASLNLSLKCIPELDSEEELALLANKKLEGALFELDDAIMLFHDF